jgi:hypothetical protein
MSCSSPASGRWVSVSRWQRGQPLVDGGQGALRAAHEGKRCRAHGVREDDRLGAGRGAPEDRRRLCQGVGRATQAKEGDGSHRRQLVTSRVADHVLRLPDDRVGLGWPRHAPVEVGAAEEGHSDHLLVRARCQRGEHRLDLASPALVHQRPGEQVPDPESPSGLDTGTGKPLCQREVTHREGPPCGRVEQLG